MAPGSGAVEEALPAPADAESRRSVRLHLRELAPILIGSETISTFSGPLPPPNTLAEYDRRIPGAAERILRMAESEQARRHQAEAELLRISRNGSAMAFIVVMTVVIGAFGLLFSGKTVLGLAPLILVLAPLAGTFITRRHAPPPTASDTGNRRQPLTSAATT